MDAIDIRPDRKGAAGRAWRCDLAEMRSMSGHRLGHDDATLAVWVVEAPWAHPIWHSYAIILVHLRAMADGRETKIYLPGATHEFWLYALDPKGDRAAVIAGLPFGEKSVTWLTPANFVAQFIEDDDVFADARIADTVQLICNGELSPDTDFRRQWIALFGDAMMKK